MEVSDVSQIKEMVKGALNELYDYNVRDFKIKKIFRGGNMVGIAVEASVLAEMKSCSLIIDENTGKLLHFEELK